MRNGRYRPRNGAARTPLRRKFAHLRYQIKVGQIKIRLTGPTIKTRIRHRLRLRPRQARAALETARWTAAMIGARRRA